MSGHRAASLVTLLCFVVLSMSPLQTSAQTGEVVVRVADTSGSHCINAETEKVTVFLRRVFTEKNKGWFTEDNRAGVLVRTQLVASDTDPKNASGQASVQIPSVDLVSVIDDQKGRVSLALEYGVASDFVLSQDSTSTKTMDIYINLAKTKGKTTFGDVLELAGQALQQVSLPTNPYLQAGSKFLKFANDAIDKNIKVDNAEPIAHIALKFSEGPEDNLAKCKSAGNERTGAIAVLRSVGAAGESLIPVTNTEQLYCFRYSSDSTYELLAAKRKEDGSCPAATIFRGVPNDYVMLLISAQPVKKPGKGVKPSDIAAAQKESLDRCHNFQIDVSNCGSQE